MPSYKQSALAILSIAAVANATGYAQFCENFQDGTAKDGCGKVVATQNEGCLKESGRHSLHFTERDGGLYFPVLVAYTDDNCQNEKGCNAIGQGGSGSEFDIDFNSQGWKFAEGAQSFKFLHGHGGAPTCPNGCVGQYANTASSRVMRAREEEILEQNSKQSVNETKEIEKRQGGANYWFCDDDNCSVNCGNHIEPSHAGCANGEYGRHSVFAKGLGHLGDKSLNIAAYGNNDCNGDEVATVNAPNGCTKLPGQYESWNVVGFQTS